jgi:molybdate transport system substrate-binding protein
VTQSRRITPALMEYYKRKAHRLRAEAYRNMGRIFLVGAKKDHPAALTAIEPPALFQYADLTRYDVHQKSGRKKRMKPRPLVRSISMIGIAVLLLMGAASAADVHVMISSGFHGAYSELVPIFERATGNHLVTTRGPSMGDSPEAIPARLARGESADVVILDGGAADELGKRGLVQADSKVELARSLIGMVVREGAEKPDITSVTTFRNTLLAAKSIAYSDSGSGTYLSTVLFQKLGVADQIAAKSRKVRGPPSGEPVAAVVARGEAEIGFQQVAELIHVSGVTLVGALPAEVQPMFSFAGVLTKAPREAEAARALLLFLSSREAAATVTKAGLTPPPDR